MQKYTEVSFKASINQSTKIQIYKDTGRYTGILSVLREAELIEGTELPEEWNDALEQYQETLHKHSYFDFTTIMTEEIKNLKTNEIFKEKVLGKLKYLIVDEYQDVNPIQEELIQQLSKEGCILRETVRNPIF